MDPSLLEKFRLQLAAWIELRLDTQPLPFQKLEVSPRILTAEGRLAPDLVLWINRDSQLAGSMILLPVSVDEATLAEARALAEALGLNHFATWAAREVCIWSLAGQNEEKIHSFLLPAARDIIPHDFQETLDDLLEQLKVVSVTHALPREELSVYYFANLCLHNLQELTPGLTISARLTAGQTENDEWIEKAPREKAWLSLWRILFLLSQGKLPPGLRPDRLEDAIQYALTDTTAEAGVFSYRGDEPPLPEEDAVRLYHLAGRLKQLGWPQNSQEADQLVWILIEEAAHRFLPTTPQTPWKCSNAELRVFSHPSDSSGVKAIIAPRAYLAGWTLKSILGNHTGKTVCAEKLGELDTRHNWINAVASFEESQHLDRKEYDKNLILLRKVWPNRRFDLPRSTPSWVWDSIFLAGLSRGEFTINLPENWHHAPGLDDLWNLLEERCHLTDLSINSDRRPSLRFQLGIGGQAACRVHRDSDQLDLPENFSTRHRPGTIHFWLTADLAVSKKVIESMTCGFGNHWPEERQQLESGAWFYLHTTFGRHIWNLCCQSAPLPETSEVFAAVTEYGVPVPDAGILMELALSLATHEAPQQAQLDHEFKLVFGPTPPVGQSYPVAAPEKLKGRRRPRISPEETTAKSLSDGLPRFPEHYLMGTYQVDLSDYELRGPLKISGDFFDRFSLQTDDGEFRLEVTGSNLAEALVLASYSVTEKVALPDDEELLDQILANYKADLSKLWDLLVRECRRVAPARKAASRLARKIWHAQGLPPVST